ncbi:hypothetical protein [Pleionea sediminis]|uniref:hypothetical protein n=1 Tax=Pleionea sediminis TaxID=2569479 RepID=UPI0011864FA7|nr:hypothetical protein [Pleionea sediminis]
MTKLLTSSITALSTLCLTSCSSEFLRALDQATVGMGGKPTCQYSRNKQTDSYKGYKVTWGGYCNYWEVKVSNWSRYTIKCRLHNGSGRFYRNLFVNPGQTTDEMSIAHMRDPFYYNCESWARAPYMVKSKGKLALEQKMNQGKIYNRVQNKSNRKAQCYFKRGKAYLLKQVVQPYGWTQWKYTGTAKLSYGCRRI